MGHCIVRLYGSDAPVRAVRGTSAHGQTAHEPNGPSAAPHYTHSAPCMRHTPINKQRQIYTYINNYYMAFGVYAKATVLPVTLRRGESTFGVRRSLYARIATSDRRRDACRANVAPTRPLLMPTRLHYATLRKVADRPSAAYAQPVEMTRINFRRNND